MKKKLLNKTAIITGASQGLGLKIAEHFVAEGANVFICARDEDKLNDAVKKLNALCSENTVFAKAGDISDPVICAHLIDLCLEKYGNVDVLINNAGIHGAKGPVDETDWQAWESAIDINLKGTVLMTRFALTVMKKKRSGKIIILSGGGATKPMPFMSAYAASKAGLVRFSETLAEEVKSFGIDVNAVAPGMINTRLLDDVLQAGPESVGNEKYIQAVAQKKKGGDDPSRAANLCVFLASSESDGITGKLISAIWDPWEKLPGLMDQLAQSDIYTLRRILPADRGKNWSDA